MIPQSAQARAKGEMPAKNPGKSAQDAIGRLDPAHRPKIVKRLAEMPGKCRPAYLRAMSGKSKAAAIRAFCRECMGWEGLPHSVRSCTAPACPLFPYRPGAGYDRHPALAGDSPRLAGPGTGR